MRTTASGTPAHTPNSPRFTPGPWHEPRQELAPAAADPRPLLGSPVFGVYAIAPDAQKLDVQLHLEARMAQLEAMLLVPYGDGGEAFRGLNEDSQEAFMWACRQMASEVRALFDVLGVMRAEGSAK